MLLEHFDPTFSAVFDPEDLVAPVPDMPKTAVCCFSRAAFEHMAQRWQGDVIAKTGSANGETPVYRLRNAQEATALALLPVGAAACAGTAEELFAMGAETLVVFGSCGVLDERAAGAAVILPTFAMRDEGTSYHYAPSEQEIEVNLRYRTVFADLLRERKLAFVSGKTWTTDAFYRATVKKMTQRKAMGCICMDMECSALAAVAAFRHKEVFQFFHDPERLPAQQAALLAMELAERMKG